MQGGTGSQSREALSPDFLPDRHEVGTQNAHGIAGLYEGLKFVCNGRDIYRHERDLLDLCAEELLKIPGMFIYYDRGKGVQSGVISFKIAGISPEEISYQLSLLDIAVRAGFHCAPLAHETAGDRIGTVRVSFSAFNNSDDVLNLIRALWKIKK